ncbi:uncharacterized protein A4U43_C04F20090 [Asparagus officinalis]|uniref:Uncharacterized protein n=1 Tax=Asparagus officinalis TaxID=4686 RepID=A0A5P1F2W2_ASPOF|nr:uncharacterized protein A4U43_C04F20090 [Asparagus officinalis]
MDPGTEKETIAEEKRSEKNHEKLEEGNDVDIMIDINDEDLMFADEDLIFSSLPDFPCLSSPTANSSTNLNSNRNPSISSASSSSSSSSSWALFSNEGLAQEAHMQPQNSWRHRVVGPVKPLGPLLPLPRRLRRRSSTPISAASSGQRRR